MKKLIVAIFLFFYFLNPVFAINWVDIVAPNGNKASIDVDSIKEFKNYIFFNLKIFNSYKNNYTVVTIQSRSKTPLAARIRFYTADEYESLQGDYENITNNFTTSLEPVEYGSVVYACYAKVKSEFVSDKAVIQF